MKSNPSQLHMRQSGSAINLSMSRLETKKLKLNISEQMGVAKLLASVGIARLSQVLSFKIDFTRSLLKMAEMFVNLTPLLQKGKWQIFSGRFLFCFGVPKRQALIESKAAWYHC